VAHLLYLFLLYASIYSHPFPQTEFYILTGYLGMRNSYRPNHQRCCCRSVVEIIQSWQFIQTSEGGQFAAEYVPERIRYLLIAESAANDGLAYPFLSIAIYLTTEASPAIAFEKWIVISCLCV